MSAGAIKAGEAFVRIWANDADAHQALNVLQSRVKRFADDVSAMERSFQIRVVMESMNITHLHINANRQNI